MIARVPPFRFFVDGGVGDFAQLADHPAVGIGDEARRKPRARRFVHKRHELVREAGHRAADANAADVRATADAAHPPALGDVAIDYGPPAAEFDDALRRAVFVREIALLVIARAVAAFV